MVESIGLKTVGGDFGIARVANVAPAPSVRTANPDLAATNLAAADVAETGGIAKALAATPPIDTDRVALIKQAIANGQFPILPAKIADSLIALKLEWAGK